MSGRRGRLDRLLAIRRLSEEIERRSVQLALASVAEVDAAMARQRMALTESGRAAESALAAGDRDEWLMAELQREAAGWNRTRLQVVKREREAKLAPAMARFLETRMEHEQVKQLVRNAEEIARTEDDRRAQSAADDWFLSKRARAKE